MDKQTKNQNEKFFLNNPELARKVVVEHMHWNGEDSNKLNTTEELRVYSLADGFGLLDSEQLQEIGYDWSHIRDSSPAGFARMASEIQEIKFNKGL